MGVDSSHEISHQSHQTWPSKSTWLRLRDYNMSLSLAQVSEAVHLHVSIWWHSFSSELFRIHSLKFTAWICRDQESKNSACWCAVRMSLQMAPVCKAFGDLSVPLHIHQNNLVRQESSHPSGERQVQWSEVLKSPLITNIRISDSEGDAVGELL